MFKGIVNIHLLICCVQNVHTKDGGFLFPHQDKNHYNLKVHSIRPVHFQVVTTFDFGLQKKSPQNFFVRYYTYCKKREIKKLLLVIVSREKLNNRERQPGSTHVDKYYFTY